MEPSPLKVAIFSDCYIPRVNGVVTSVFSQKLCMEKLGHQVQLVVPRYPHDYHVAAPSWAHPDVVEHRVLRLWSNSMKQWPDDRFSWPWPLAPLWKILRTRWDIVHLHTPFNIALLGVLTARMAGCPLVFTHHTQWEEYSHYIPYVTPSVGRWMARVICDYYFQRSKLIVCPSQEVQESLRRRDPRLPSAVVPTGIEPELFSGGDPNLARACLAVDSSTPIFLYVGRLGREKSVDFLLRCHKELLLQFPQARLVIIGGGPGLEELQNQSHQMEIGDSCHFLGWKPRSELRHYLAAARAFVFASETETQGLVLLEAAAAGTPVVAIKASGVNEAVIDGETGILIESGQQALFVQELCRFAQGPQYGERFRGPAQVQAQRFSSEASAHTMVREYRKLQHRPLAPESL